MKISAFKSADVDLLDVQPGQQVELGTVAPEDARRLEGAPGPSWTFWRDGKPIACLGLIELWRGDYVRYMAWGLLSPTDTYGLLWLTRRFKNYLASGLTKTRIEFTAAADFPQANRWAKVLGFQPVGVLKQYGPDGRDFILYDWTAP